MARFKRTARTGATGPRRSWLVRIGLGFAVLVLVAVMLLGGQMRAYARLGAAFGARVACSCHYVAGRLLDDCRHDFEPGMALVTLSADDATHTVTARLFPLARARASWSAGPGCVMERWGG